MACPFLNCHYLVVEIEVLFGKHRLMKRSISRKTTRVLIIGSYPYHGTFICNQMYIVGRVRSVVQCHNKYDSEISFGFFIRICLAPTLIRNFSYVVLYLFHTYMYLNASEAVLNTVCEVKSLID